MKERERRENYRDTSTVTNTLKFGEIKSIKIAILKNKYHDNHAYLKHKKILIKEIEKETLRNIYM